MGDPVTFFIICEHHSSTDFPSAVSSGISYVQLIMAEKMAKGTAQYVAFVMELQNCGVIKKFCLCPSSLRAIPPCYSKGE